MWSGNHLVKNPNLWQWDNRRGSSQNRDGHIYVCRAHFLSRPRRAHNNTKLEISISLSLLVVFSGVGQSRTLLWALETRTESNPSHFCYVHSLSAGSNLTPRHVHTFHTALSKPQGSHLHKVHHGNLIKIVNVFQIATTSWWKELLSFKIRQ